MTNELTYSFSIHRPRVAAFGGGPAPFGQKPANAFGTGNAFGTTPQATAGFGGAAGAFGSNTAPTGAFGQPAAANNAAASTSTFGGGGFGAANNNNAWGKPAAQTGFGAIGGGGKLESHSA